jgi:hypothetical protein
MIWSLYEREVNKKEELKSRNGIVSSFLQIVTNIKMFSFSDKNLAWN